MDKREITIVSTSNISKIYTHRFSKFVKLRIKLEYKLYFFIISINIETSDAETYLNKHKERFELREIP